MALTPAPGQQLSARYVTVMKRTTAGYPAGDVADPASLVNGTLYNAYLIKHIISLDKGIAVNPRVRDVSGGQVRSSQFMPKIDLGTPSFVLSQEDETFIATFVKNNAVDVTTNTAMAIRDDNPGQTVFPSLIVGFHEYVQRVSGTGIVNYWDNVYYLDCQIQQASEGTVQQITGDTDNPVPMTYNLTLSNSTRSVLGYLISAMNTSNETAEASVQRIRTLKPLMTSLYVDDGATATKTFPYRPVNADATGAAENSVTKNGAVQTITSFDTTTAAAIWVAASATDLWPFCYQTNFVAP